MPEIPGHSLPRCAKFALCSSKNTDISFFLCIKFNLLNVNKSIFANYFALQNKLHYIALHHATPDRGFTT
ncbi:MAG: hypothetical protein C0629_00200 [Chromatiales bacterium]|nr:MAG: hypothetical protein C0629_00200 [Chromatiales bacterium]